MPILEKGQISAQQLLFLIIGFGYGSATLFTPGGDAHQDAWLAVIIGTIEGILFAVIYLALAKRFPGKTLIEISDVVWGPILGKVFAIAFLIYLFHLGSLVITNAMDFIKFTFLPFTPVSISMLFGVAVCVIAAAAGIEVLARSVTILAIFTTVMFLLLDLLVIPQIKLINFLPVLETPLHKLLAAAHGTATFPFGETVAFLMVIPFVNNHRKFRPAVLMGLAFTGLMFVLAQIRNIGVLGATAGYFLYPSFGASSMINIGEVFTRVEIVIGTNFLITTFIKIAILIYCVMLGTAQVLKLKSYQTLAIPLWIIITLIGIHNFANVTENVVLAKNYYPFYSLPFEVGIPLLTLLMAIIRKLPRENE
jgi:spore germination protein KB